MDASNQNKAGLAVAESLSNQKMTLALCKRLTTLTTFESSKDI